MTQSILRPSFPYFGAKRSIAGLVWSRFGKVKQYLEPFFGSGAVLLGCPSPARLEVVNDQNYYVANFWRALKNQPDRVIQHADHPVVHVDLTARHRWLVNYDRVQVLRSLLLDADWPGDPKIAGWWVWGLCAWIGSGWCDSSSEQVPFYGNRGRGINGGQKPFYSADGQGINRRGRLDELHALGERMRRVVVINGDWHRSVNTHYGLGSGGIAGLFFDPPYKNFENLYADGVPVAEQVEQWCRERTDVPRLRMALCGHVGDYDLPGWEIVQWSRDSTTYGSDKTKAKEAVWFSPQCYQAERAQLGLFTAGLD